jgi:glycosyltransferase involved in cell wall biosynthesis
VVAVGRLIPIKGFDLLIDAVGDRADVVIIGAGSEHDRLCTRARHRSVALRLPGTVPRSDLPAWLAAADVYVQPSRRLDSGRTEGVPLAALEALAVGAPVIAARSGGLAELGARASYFEAGDVGSLRAALSLALPLG